jgi:hypothetical protein
MKKVGLLLVAAVVVAGLGGCGSAYYFVKDPVGGGTFYTKEIEVVRGGAVTFRDARNGATVTIQNSSVKEITEEEFNVGIYTPEPAKPAPAPTPLQIQVTPAAPAAAPAPPAASGPAPAPVEAPAQGN